MNRYIYILFMWLCSLSAMAQTDGYNPNNPPLPNFPTDEPKDTTYTLVVNSSPYGSGSLNTSGGNYKEGASVYLRAYNNGDMYFMYWIDDEGNTLTTSTSFNYIMPKRDAVVTAVYRYSPSNPALPDFPEDTNIPTYNLKLDTKPAGAGSFNTSNTNLKEGESIHLYAYSNSNFYFKRWEDAQGNVISTAQNFYYSMPAVDTQLFAIYTYNPSNPSNPGKNYYDSFTGEVIIDDFTKGNLSSAIYDVTKGNTSNITSITVAGVINSNDFSIANNYSSCSIVDLSRTNGVNTVPSYCYDGNTHLNRLSLPACITNIEYRAFRNATALTELTCHATVPPTLGSNVFSGVNKGLVVYVPASSIQLYEQAVGWKEYEADGTIVIMPIQSQVSALEVNLPTECADGRYKNMPLELLNVKSGQKFKYVITDRINYTFNNLVNGTRYVATLKNRSGQVLAKTDTISIADENISVTFDLASMKQLRSVKASVLTNEGTDVTSNCVITWYDANGTFLSQNKSLDGQVSESKVRCAVSLSQALAMEYVLPADSVYEVIEDDNIVNFTLVPLPKMQIFGRILDLTTQQAISNASITVSQTLNGKYSKSLSGKTDNKGAYTMTVFVAPSSVTFAANDYVSQTIELADSVFTKEESTLADVKLKPITGATITTNFTYTNSVAAGVEPDVQNYYSDYNNVTYNIYNVTAQKEIRQFNVQYPNIVLLEEVNQGDSLQIIARSKVGSFVDVTIGGRINDALRMDVTIPVVQLGGIDATFTTTENSKVLGILYDSKGTYVNKYNYGTATLSIRELKDGEYTLVTMGVSDFFGSIYNLEKFSVAGLQQNIDYLVNKVTVKSGVITPLKNVLVPFFDESKFYYTGDNTSFTVNKTSIVAGNYLTLTAKVDFKPVYASSISDVKVSVELPEGTTMVDNSVMVGSSVAYYELNGNTLTIPLDNNVSSDRVRFCVIPTQSGSFAPSATVSFKLGEKSVSQPMGSAMAIVKDIAIRVPSVVATPNFSVSGLAMGKSQVMVYDAGNLLGSTTTLSNGYWYLDCELDEPYNLSVHQIYATITTPDGLYMETESKSVLYDEYTITPKTVTMSFYNGWLKKNVDVTWDFETKKTDNNSYMFYTGTDVTFTIELSNNDSTLVSAVKLFVYTDKNEVRELESVYNENINKWVATSFFNSDNLPINVNVSVVSHPVLYADRREFDNNVQNLNARFDAAKEIAREYQEEEKNYTDGLAAYDIRESRINNLIEQIENSIDEAEIDSLYHILYQIYGIEIEKYEEDSSIVIDEAYINQLIADYNALFSEENEEVDLSNADELLDKADEFIVGEDDPFDYVGSILTAENDTVEVETESGTKTFYRLPLDDFDFSKYSITDTISIPMTEGHDIMVYLSDNQVLITDSTKMEIWVLCDKDVASQAKIMFAAPKRAKGDFVAAMNEASHNIQWLINTVGAVLKKLIDDANDEVKKFRMQYDDMLNKRAILIGKSAGKSIRLQEVERQLQALQSNSVASAQHNFAIFDRQAMIVQLKHERATLMDDIADLDKRAAKINVKANGIKAKSIAALGVLSTIKEAWDVIQGFRTTIAYINASISDYNHWHSLINVILPCADDYSNASALKKQCESDWHDIAWGKGYYPAFAITGICTLVNGYLMVNKGVKFLIGFLIGTVTDFLKNTAEVMYTQAKNTSLRLYPIRYYEYQKLKCKKKDPKDEPDKPEDNPDPQNPPFDPVSPIHDPSGYVYEGVSSNRLQGVTATAYYKEMVEDMYGDLHENIVLWDAEEYAQKNPLFTDENGMYQWDVPQGLWQVRFEKEGYVPTQSEWLPVPPPQMDVNIGMVQNAQPEVVSARAYEDGVEIEFSKYMNIESLNSENVYLKVVNGEEESLITDAEIQMLNKEVTIEGSTTEFASKMKLATDQLGYYDEAYIIISTGVNSYAGIPMAQTFEQKLDVEKKVRELLVDAELNVEYDGQKQIIIAAIPAEAAAGKKLSIVSASNMIATTDVQEVTFDADGQATFTVNGELYGATALNYSLVDADLKAITLINVVDPKKLEAVKAPVASRISGTAVYRGQTVSLSCESEGATIYYTLDGSCPCDENARMKYERPIAINDAMTIKFMAVGTNYDESDVIECTYSIRQSDVKLNLAKGWNWNSHDVASPIDVKELSDVALRILTQTDEVIDDPVLGFVGTLTTIDGSETMKIEAKASATKSFTGEQYNPALSPIVLHEGWNWLGYPISQTMTVTDALSYMDADEGDCISNLEDGFATYTDGEWIGSLEIMNPGAGYLYKSAMSKSFIYKEVPAVQNAKALYGHRLAPKSIPWNVDKHRYPNLMPVIAQVCYSNGDAADSTYYVGAFVGEECRGVDKYTDGIMYLSVYGDESVDLTFKAWNVETESVYDFAETLKFTPDVVGTYSSPYKLMLGFESTGINHLNANNVVDGIYSIQGIKLNSIPNRGIYIIKSKDENGNSIMKKTYVK